jgi:hypothetical protein
MQNEAAMFQHIEKMNEHSASLLLLLLCADSAFIVLHIISKTLVLNCSLCNTLGLYEHLTIYQLVKLFWVIVLLAYVLKSTRCSGYVSWILVFTYFLFDKALQIHQNAGNFIANNFGTYLPQDLSLRPRYLQLAVLAIVGTFLFAIVAWAYSHSPYAFRKISNDMFLFIAVWASFGLITDLAAATKLGPAVEFASDFVEDGGEMAVVSLILWYVFLLVIRNGKPDWFLLDLLCKPLKMRCT